ncbi:response regulator transcription factor [Sphingobacterium corticis]|uniref:Response regulator transcription factor n=1 Tax=Sphingobacterium corticis TaxID=1812823 RepID=A0ABW5NK11_9SPHI
MKKILLVEDNEIMQKLIIAILEKEGYHVKMVGNGKDALDLLSAENVDFDLIVTDIMMPYASGFEVLNKVSKLEGKRIPTIIVSSLSNEEMILEGFKLGASDYLTKPIMAGELVLRVKRLLQQF